MNEKITNLSKGCHYDNLNYGSTMVLSKINEELSP